MFIKFYCKFLFIIIILFISCVTTNDVQNANDEILKCFEKYQQALFKKDYANLKQLVNKETFRYFDNLINIAIYGNKNQILVQPLLIDKIYILIIRHLIPLNDLLCMNGEDFFILGIKENYINSNLNNIKIKQIEVENIKAIADIQFEDQATDMKIIFKKEKKEWKIDVSSILAFLNKTYINLIEQYDIDEPYFLEIIINSITGVEIDSETLFKPLL